MKNLFRSSAVLTIFAIAFAFISTPVQAQDPGTFDITVKHNINGVSLGGDFEKELPVDVYVNGDYTFTFSFGETFSASLPADVYEISVFIAGTGTEIESMRFGPAPIPAGVDVMIKAQLSGGKTPVLKVKVK